MAVAAWPTPASDSTPGDHMHTSSIWLSEFLHNVCNRSMPNICCRRSGVPAPYLDADVLVLYVPASAQPELSSRSWGLPPPSGLVPGLLIPAGSQAARDRYRRRRAAGLRSLYPRANGTRSEVTQGMTDTDVHLVPVCTGLRWRGFPSYPGSVTRARSVTPPRMDRTRVRPAQPAVSTR